MKTKYRSRFDIIALILRGAVEGSAKTRLMYLAYVSYNQLDEYLDFLMKTGLLAETPTHQAKSKRLYTTTEKGLRFLLKYEELAALLPAVEGGFTFKTEGAPPRPR